MRIPVVTGTINRRLLVNFRADAEVVQRILPEPFSPKLHQGHAIVGICPIRLEHERLPGFPAGLGTSSENAAHRFAVQWLDDSGAAREGVYIPRRDTNSAVNLLLGGRAFAGEQMAAEFKVSESAGHIELSMRSRDGETAVDVVGDEASSVPPTSCFKSLDEASAYFEAGSLGYSPTMRSKRLDGIELVTTNWRVGALDVSAVHSSYFEDQSRFPAGSIEFDHALVMRDLKYEWRAAGRM